MIITLKCSIGFLNGPVPKIITKGTGIATKMTGNLSYPLPPVTPVAFQGHIDTLETAQAKVDKGSVADTVARDTALLAVSDDVHKLAEYVQNTAANDLTKFLTSGFDPRKDRSNAPVPDHPTTMKLKDGKNSGEVQARINKVEHCTIAIGRFSDSATFPPATTTEVTGKSPTVVLFTGRTPGVSIFIQVKCRGTHGDSDWGPTQPYMPR